MKLLFLHGWQSTPGGLKPTYLKKAGHEVLNPALDDEDFAAAVQTAQAEYDQHQPEVVVGSSRGGAVAMNINTGNTPVVLLCPAWKHWGAATTVKPNTVILHSPNDETIPFADSQELIPNSDLPASALIEVGNDHRLADEESLAKMLEVVEAMQQLQPQPGAATIDKSNADNHATAAPMEPPLEMLFSFFEGVRRKGPGSEASTLKALSLLKNLPPNPRIIELGCGAGVASIPLARSLACQLTAIDIHQPFLDELMAVAVREGLADRITTSQADMGNPPFPDGSFDLIWSEAAIYNIGFESGLRLWKPLLRHGGYIAVSEVVWLTPEPPQQAKEFWNSDYPSMTSVEDNLSTLSALGFDQVDHFLLPQQDWQAYYGPLEERVAEFRSQHADDAAAQSLADSMQAEIDLWKKYGDSFGYCFFTGRAI